MEKATYIKPEDLQDLQMDENGNFIIPDGIEIYIKPNPEEIKLNRITKIQEELSKLTEPTDEELIDLGKSSHPYYLLLDELNELQNQ